jgi:hypothetical protein
MILHPVKFLPHRSTERRNCRIEFARAGNESWIMSRPLPATPEAAV